MGHPLQNTISRIAIRERSTVTHTASGTRFFELYRQSVEVYNI